MSLKNLVRLSLFFLLSLGLCVKSHSQRQTLAGLSVNGEIYPEINFKPNIAGTLERQITRHSGGETGLYYHTKLSTGIITHTDASGSHAYSFTISQRHMTVPVLYKYYSNIINFSAGPAFDFYLGWKQKDDEFPFQMKSYDVNPHIKVGFLAKASKFITLNKQLILEPEIRFGSVQTLDEAALGIGIAGKYRF